MISLQKYHSYYFPPRIGKILSFKDIFSICYLFRAIYWMKQHVQYGYVCFNINVVYILVSFHNSLLLNTNTKLVISQFSSTSDVAKSPYFGNKKIRVPPSGTDMNNTS